MINLLEKIIIVTGHYGSGKTNLSVNLAVDLRRRGDEVALVDLDVVNPYFRSADFQQLAREHGFALYAPPYANSNVDLPMVTPELHGLLGGEATVVIDVGGDDAGAMALGAYAPRIAGLPYTMLYVINHYRNLIAEPAEAAALMEEIETASRLRVTHLVNNSHLSYLTGVREVEDSLEYARRVSEVTGRPLAFTSARRDIADKLNLQDIYPVDIYVKTPWQ